MCVCPVIPWQSAHSSLLSLDNNSSPAHSVISLPSPPHPKTGQGLSFPNLRHQLLSLHTFQQPVHSVQRAWSGLATEWPPYTSALSEMSSMSLPDYRARCTGCTLPATLMRLQPVIHEYEGGEGWRKNERKPHFSFLLCSQCHIGAWRKQLVLLSLRLIWTLKCFMVSISL